MTLFYLDFLTIKQCYHGWELYLLKKGLEYIEPVLEPLIVVKDDLVTDISEEDHVFNWVLVDNLIFSRFQIPPCIQVFGHRRSNLLLLFLFLLVMVMTSISMFMLSSFFFITMLIFFLGFVAMTMFLILVFGLLFLIYILTYFLT